MPNAMPTSTDVPKNDSQMSSERRKGYQGEINYFIPDEDEPRKIYDANVLFDAYMKSKKNSNWKKPVIAFGLNWLPNLYDIQTKLMDNTYEFGETSEFVTCERGKTRVIHGERIEDRIVKHALCDEVLNPKVRKKLIYDNGASLPNKGIKFARERLERHLSKFYREHGSNDGYILLMDFSKYYDNIRHDKALEMLEPFLNDDCEVDLLRKAIARSEVDVSYMKDEEYDDCLDIKFNSLEYLEIDKELLTGEKFMKKHLDIGDQVAQTIGVLYPSRIDNYVKTVKSVAYYGRYMDDSYAIHESKEFLVQLRSDIIKIADELGIFMNEKKMRICKLSDYWRYLQIQYSLTDTGRIIKKINPKRVTAMKHRLAKIAPYLTKKEYADYFHSWMGANCKYMSKLQRENMDEIYNKHEEECSRMYTMVLSDGTEIKNLALNGNNMVADRIVDDSEFEGKLSKVTFRDEETGKEQTYENMRLENNSTYGSAPRSFLLFSVPSQNEKILNDLQIAIAEAYETALGGE